MPPLSELGSCHSCRLGPVVFLVSFSFFFARFPLPTRRGSAKEFAPLLCCPIGGPGRPIGDGLGLDASATWSLNSRRSENSLFVPEVEGPCVGKTFQKALLHI